MYRFIQVYTGLFSYVDVSFDMCVVMKQHSSKPATPDWKSCAEDDNISGIVCVRKKEREREGKANDSVRVCVNVCVRVCVCVFACV